MSLRQWTHITTLVLGAGLLSSVISAAQLNLKYGPSGLEKVTYAGIVLEDTSQYKNDIFHIGHMKVTDRNGKLIAADGWGENNLGKSWDPVTKTWTYQFRWGGIRAHYAQNDNSLDIIITETNRTDSGVVIAGASVYPLALHFPTLPKAFTNATYPQGGSNTTGPNVILGDFGTAEVASVSADASKPLYNFLWPVNGATPTYAILISSTPPDGLAEFQPHHDRPLLPGQSDSLRLSLRFAPSGTAVKTLAADAYAQWTAQWPMQLHWPDRRIIGTAYLATSPSAGAVTHHESVSNPRRYFITHNEAGIDIRTPEGLKVFQTRVLDSAREIVRNLQRMKAQGVITWDIEGEEYPQEISYVCSPDQISTEAPEMETPIADPHSTYAGQKLDDAYFRIIREAGYKVGVCVRPQRFVKSLDGTAHQSYLPAKEAEAELLRKIRYAHDRWGATLFYIDSTVEANGAVMDAGLFRRLAASFPDSLLIPEQSSPKHHAYTAPFKTFLFHQDLGTDSGVQEYYPESFSCNLINDATPTALAAFTPQFIAHVAAGDILMAHADYWDPNNLRVMAIYEQAVRLKANRGH